MTTVTHFYQVLKEFNIFVFGLEPLKYKITLLSYLSISLHELHSKY
jgi:hypothetical protein